MRNIEITHKNLFSSSTHFPHIHMIWNVETFLNLCKVHENVNDCDFYGVVWLVDLWIYELVLKTNLKINFP